MSEAITWISENGQAIFGVVSGLISIAALITAMTPSPKDDGVVSKIRAILDLVGMNWGFARNKGGK